MKNLTQISNNVTKLTLGTTEFFYSYETVVAARVGGHLMVSQNVWSVTTGKHLTKIDGGSKEAKAARLPHAEFTAQLAKLGA